jgi:hypothetical protein
LISMVQKVAARLFLLDQFQLIFFHLKDRTSCIRATAIIAELCA